ncbi:MAG: hypothetical protein KDC38_14730 [Planctomycetes bacterium]|nr:hypothetical protein [Planctomycetota bacterium]
MTSSTIGTLFHLGPTPVIEETMAFAEARHRLILSNVANSDTPHYRRQDLDEDRFRRTLERAIHDRRHQHPAEFRMGGATREAVSTWGGALRGPRVTTLPFEGPTRHDENNVSMEREMSILAMNAAKYTSMSSLLRKELNQLRAAITERPGN